MSIRIIDESKKNKVNLDIKVPALRDENEKYIILTVCDSQETIYNLLDCIKTIANQGHSFNVVVDPGDEDEEKFFIDGDGMDHIYDITIDEYKGEI